MCLSFYFILKFRNHDFFTSVCFIHIKRIGHVKAGIACDELIKHFPIRLNEPSYHKNIHNSSNTQVICILIAAC